MQQINLLQDVLIVKPQPLRGRQVLGLFVLVLLLLLLFSFVSYRQTAGLNAQVRMSEQQKLEAGERIAQLEHQYPQPQKNELLEQKVVQLERELKNLKDSLALVASRQQQGNGLLLGSLEGLARHPLPGVWLRSLRVGRSAADIRLQGRALRSELVPEYMQLLRDEQVLGGQLFTRLTVTRLEEEPGQVDFELVGGAGAQ
jgi:cell division protein FtsB